MSGSLARAVLPLSFQAYSAQRISGNSIVEILHDGIYLWVGTNNGISRIFLAGDSVKIFNRADGLNSEEISAMGFQPGRFRLLAASAHSELIDDFEFPFGEGFNYTTDAGLNWFRSLPFQASSPGMLAYDITSFDTVFYASCFYGGLIRSFDGGVNWENIYVDSLAQIDFEDSNYNDLRNRYFAVASQASGLDTAILWAGSAAGIQKFIFTDSLDFDTVEMFQKTDTLICIFPDTIICDSADKANGFHAEIDTLICGISIVIQADTVLCSTADTVIDFDTLSVYPSISGNFIAALGVQYTSSGTAIWAAARPTFTGIMAVNWTKDGGKNWDTTLTDEPVWDFAFQDTLVWAATSSGLKRSLDWGESWKNFIGMEDFSDTCHRKIFSPEFFAVEAVGDTLWAGGADGLVRTFDGGQTWRVYRAYEPIGSPGSASAYAYPSPFSPRLGSGVTRIHHKPLQSGSVTVQIFDFAMNQVITLVKGQPRIGGEECDEPWDGRDQDGEEVASGVYFFKVESPGQTQWGKIVVLK